MDFNNPWMVALLGVVVLAGSYWAATHFFSAEARWERRRRRSNAPLTNTSNRPSVKLSVRTKKSRRQ